MDFDVDPFAKSYAITQNEIVNEIVFQITQESDGGFCAECLTESIFTQGYTWDELQANVREAAEAFYFDGPKPSDIHLHLPHRVSDTTRCASERSTES